MICGARARDHLPAPNSAFTYSSHTPTRSSGALPTTRVAFAKSAGSRAVAPARVAHPMADAITTTTALIEATVLLSAVDPPNRRAGAPRGTPAPRITTGLALAYSGQAACG